MRTGYEVELSLVGNKWVINAVKKPRPAFLVKTDDMNMTLSSVLVAQLTRKGQSLGCRSEFNFEGKSARILLDQLR